MMCKLLKKIRSVEITPVTGSLHTSMDVLKKYPPTAPALSMDTDANCLLQYTGGTTGVPKGSDNNPPQYCWPVDSVQSMAGPQGDAENLMCRFGIQTSAECAFLRTDFDIAQNNSIGLWNIMVFIFT